MDLLKRSFWEARYGFLGWGIAFTVSLLVIEKATAFFWIGQACMPIILLFLGYMVARYNPTK